MNPTKVLLLILLIILLLKFPGLLLASLITIVLISFILYLKWPNIEGSLDKKEFTTKELDICIQDTEYQAHHNQD